MNTHRGWARVRSFTLIEIMITMVIAGVLAIIAIPAYQNFIEDGRSQMCEKNLEGLDREAQVYIVEHGVVPGDLGQLPRERIEKALAQARVSAGWKAKLVSFLDEQSGRGYAFAGILEEIAKGNLGMLICPSDPKRNEAGVVSYGINSRLIGITKEEYGKLRADTVLIADSLTPTFSDAPDVSAQRHKHINGLFSGRPFTAVKYANGVKKNGEIVNIDKHGKSKGRSIRYGKSESRSENDD